MKITKEQFVKEFKEGVLPDITNKEDCINGWNSMIDSYEEDNLVGSEARRWKNPFLKEYDK